MNPALADLGKLGFELVQVVVMEYPHVLPVFQFLAKRQDLRVDLVRRGFQADHHIAHRQASIVAAFGRQKKHLPEQVLRPPVVLKYLDEVGAIPDILRNGRPETYYQIVVWQSHGYQEYLVWHSVGLIDRANNGTDDVAVGFQVSGRRDEYPVHIKSMGHDRNPAYSNQ